jgi:hypothetical protein
MAVDKLVDSTQLDTDLTAVANAIRMKGGTSASLAFPTDFVSAINAIPTGGGGGDYEIEGGTFVLSSNSKTKGVACSFQPEQAMLFAVNSTFPTDNTWKTLGGMITVWQTESFVIQRYGPSNCTGGTRTATYHTYSNGTLTFSWNYTMVSGVTYYWYAWRAKT